jgi:hypothetical protein
MVYWGCGLYFLLVKTIDIPTIPLIARSGVGRNRRDNHQAQSWVVWDCAVEVDEAALQTGDAHMTGTDRDGPV